MENNSGLKKQLNPMHVWALAFGCVIGWGSFINPGKKFLVNSGVAGTAIAMALGALVMIIIAYSYAYMVPKYPMAGGEFTFTKNCFGKTAAFICGWFLVAAYLTNVPMNSTAIALIINNLFGKENIFNSVLLYSIAGTEVYLGHVLLAGGILILFGVLNILGVRKAAFVQMILSSLLVLAVVTLVIAALASKEAALANTAPIWGFDRAAAAEAGLNAEQIRQANESVSTSGVMSAILATFAIAPWAFVGFDTIPQAAEEFKFSYKKVIGIMIVAILFGCFVYISNNTVAAAAYKLWPEEVLDKNNWVLLLAAKKLLGSFGPVLIGIGVSCAVLSGIMGFYLASSRLMFSMARDGYLPATFAKLDKKHSTPKNAMIFCIVISLSGPLLGREALGWFVDMCAIGASIGYFFTSAATLVTMKRDGDGNRLLKVMAVLGVIFSCAFMILQLVPIPGLSGVSFGKESYIMLVIWIAIGAAFYLKQMKQFKSND